MSINVTVVGSTGVTTSIANGDNVVVSVGGTLANTPLTALQVTAGANITVTTTSGVFTIIGRDVPVQSVNGQTGTVVLNLANLTAAAASHTHLMSDITDLAYPVNVVNGQTGTVLLTSTDVSAASAAHTHVASEITNLTAVANVVSVNGQTGVAVLNSTNVSAASAVHTHVMADVTGLAFPVSSVNGYTGTVSLTITDLTAAAASHTHVASDLTNLTSVANVVSVNGQTGVAVLNSTNVSAASAVHSHVMADVTDLAFPVSSVNGKTGTVSLTSVDVSAASAVHSHVMADVTDLAFPVSSVNGKTGTVSLTITDLTAADASHTHAAISITDLTNVANVVSVNGITGAPVIVGGSGVTVSTAGSSITIEAAGSTGGAALSDASPQNLGTATAGTSGLASRADHVHAMPSAMDIGAAEASHSHTAIEITDLTSVANVVSVNGQTGVVTITGGVTAASVTTKSLSVDQNDYDAGTSDIVRLTPSANVTLTGLAGGSDGVLKVLYNVGTHVVTLATGNTNSAETNRFSIVSGNVTLDEGDSASAWYDGTSQRWRVLEDAVAGGSSGPGGGIATSYLFG